MFIYKGQISMYTYMYIYIYIERERDRYYTYTHIKAYNEGAPNRGLLKVPVREAHLVLGPVGTPGGHSSNFD